MCAICKRWQDRISVEKDPAKAKLLRRLYQYHRNDPRYHVRGKL
jgi:hypothetical protein